MFTSRLFSVALALACACAGRFGRSAPQEELVLTRSSTAVVGHAEDVELTLQNRGRRALTIPRPSAPFLLVHTQTDLGAVIPCRTPPDPPERVEFVQLRPGGELSFRIDFTARCQVDSSTEFVADVRYSVPDSMRDRAAGGSSWTGATRPARLQVAPSRAAAAVPEGLPPLGPPGRDASSGASTLSAAPAGGAHPMSPTTDGPHAGELDVCVDAELTARALDPWGLPASWRRPSGPPPDLAGRSRLEYVLENVPDVRAACAALVPP